MSVKQKGSEFAFKRQKRICKIFRIIFYIFLGTMVIPLASIATNSNVLKEISAVLLIVFPLVLFIYLASKNKLKKMSKAQQDCSCPKCGSKNIGDIVYGLLITPDWNKNLKRPAKLGGCTVYPEMPTLFCVDCGNEFRPCENS